MSEGETEREESLGVLFVTVWVCLASSGSHPCYYYDRFLSFLSSSVNIKTPILLMYVETKVGNMLMFLSGLLQLAAS